MFICQFRLPSNVQFKMNTVVVWKRSDWSGIVRMTTGIEKKEVDTKWAVRLMQFNEIPPVILPSEFELNNWIDQFVEPFPLIAELTSFIMQCLNASSKLVFEKRTTTRDFVKNRLRKIILVFLNVELLILKSSQLALHWITALPPLIPNNDMELFSSIEQLDRLIF